MRVFLIACLAVVVIAVGALFTLNTVQKPAGAAYSTDGARISPSWSWRQIVAQPKPQNASMTMSKSAEAATDDCRATGAWSYIVTDFRGSPTADPVCH